MRARDIAIVAALELVVVLLFGLSLALLDSRMAGAFGIVAPIFSLLFWALAVGGVVHLAVRRMRHRLH